MKTLLVDGDWNLKKNFNGRLNYIANGKMCGGVFGFLNSLKYTIDRLLPDRVVVMWDGENSGILRYEVYKPYKAKRKSKWQKDSSGSDYYGKSEKIKKEFELHRQRVLVQSYLEDLFVRQVEVEGIEADDLIAQYVLSSRIPNEHIYIYSRDKDYHQLISENVSVLTPDKFQIITPDNFKDYFGYVVDNALLLKCFDGDSSDEIKGVHGITSAGLIEKFPEIANEKYLYSRLVEEAIEKKKSHKIKFYDKIIEAKEILYRNATLMNLKKPFVNEQAIKEINEIILFPLDFKHKDVGDAVKQFMKDGFNKFIEADLIMSFFSTFYRLQSREQEFANTNLVY